MKLLIVGCGNMGESLLKGWVSGIDDLSVFVVEGMQERAEYLAETYQVTTLTDAADLPEDYAPDVVCFAVKPDLLEKLMPLYTQFQDSVFVSVAAGKALEFYEQILGADKKIVRAMPNLPATISKGVTGLIANAHVTEKEQAIATELFDAVGEGVWLENEEQMHALTAVSGSGPAYIFAFIEALTDAGVAMGLSQDIATRLALGTVEGAACMAAESDVSATELRKRVTSKGGTTQAGLDQLIGDGKLQALLEATTKAASKRSRELSE